MEKQKNLVRLAKMAMLVAISVILVSIIHFPIFPAVAFLEYDPADIPIFIGTFAFGPIAGLMITVVVSLVQGLTVSAGSGAYGIIMHIIATGSFVIVAGFLYRHKKTKKEAIISLSAGTLTMVVVMYFANLVITPMCTGWPVTAVKELMPFILAFNAVKAGLNSIVTFLLYKRISGFLHR